jgi:hypothetical protein
VLGALILGSCALPEGFADGSPKASPDSGAAPEAPPSTSDAATATPTEKEEAGAETGADAAPSDYATRILAAQPLGYWRLDETSGTIAQDSSGHGHAGAYGASVALRASPLVGDGFAVTIDGSHTSGSEHFIRVPESPGLEPTKALTVECWMAMSDLAASANVISYGSDVSDPYEPYVLWVSSGLWRMYIVAGSGSFSVNAPDAIADTDSHHLVAVYDGTALQLYIDGKSVASTPASGDLGHYDTVNGLGIGSGASATRGNFPGVLDEVAVYGVALTQVQITEHYEAGRRR